MSRRRFLRAAAGPAGVALDAAACGGSTNSTASSTRSKWRQSEDASVNFISENTPPTAAITANIDTFTELTGSFYNRLLSIADPVSRSLDWTALDEGFQAFWRIAVPLTAPGIVTTAVLCLVFSWNDYAFAETFSGPGSQTLPTAASTLITQSGID
jgi:hypothetical protein